MAAQAALERARQLQALETQIGALESEVERLLPEQESYGQRRLRRGLKTPEPADPPPLLEVLVELGGSDDVDAILDRVSPLIQHLQRANSTTPAASPHA